MAQNLSNYDAVLKEFYEGVVRDAVNNEVVAFKELETSSREWSGRRVLFPFKTARNSGVGARSEGGVLPTAGQQGYQNSIISSTYQYGRIQLSGQVLEAGKNAFAAAMESEMKGVTSDLVNDLGRQTWGYGNGVLAQVASSATAAGASAIGVHNRFNAPGHPGARYLYEGQLIDGGTIADPDADFSSAAVTGLVISANPATTADTIEAASGLSGVSAGNFIFNSLAGGSGVEMAGIQGLIDDFSATNIFSSTGFLGSSVQNINRGSVSAFNSTVLANSSTERILDGNLMQQALDTIQIKSGMEADLIWAQHDVVRAFLESVASDRRYSTPEFAVGGSSKLSYEGIPIIKDRQAPYNSCLVMKRDVLKLYKLSDFRFADQDGAILSRLGGSGATDAYEAFIRAYIQLGIDMDPKAAVMIRDIKVDF
jgi:hypothetical protein